MASPKWMAALIGALVVELTLAVGLFIAELRSGIHGPLHSAAELVWVALGFAVITGCVTWAYRTRHELDRRTQVHTAAGATSHEWQWESDTDDVLVYSNDAIIDLLGYTPEELIGASGVDLLYDDGAKQKALPLGEADDRPQTGWSDRELTWRHRDGSPVRLEGSAAPIRDRRGHITGYRGTRRLVNTDHPGRDVVKSARERIGNVLKTNAVDIALQPIVALTTGHVTGVEALARFTDGRGPDAWFHDADLAGRTLDLDGLTFTTALTVFTALPSTVYLSVNASPDLLMDADFLARLATHDVPWTRLVIEITEHARVADYSALNNAMAPLRALGVRFAIDDTGAGYASLSHVLKLNPDIVKLDRDLIENLATDAARRSLVTALVLLAYDVGATVTGEGVETTGQLDALTSLAVDQAQGYLLSRPNTDPAVWGRWWARNLLAAPVDS